ncbi:5-formyltetrahydrofolate cyclo-ligase [Phycicoccus mangrovi]|uniref:5-formyltetrahydrofolate cyclo-ligase n=1 Tax=Phycicoccus mangrovi TaxID=2840470 RepID=UPI001D003A97|nr:5-formyltetrahydrofolate cyclo-ligase [Phycicoccus mangrovi]
MPQSAKSVRRKELRARRRAIAAERSAEADAAALARGATDLLDRLRLGPGAVVLSYESVPGEPPTAVLNDALAARGAHVLVPDTLADLDLDWHDLADPAAARLGLDAPGRADLVLAPGLTVGTDGTRMGQGGGCYDKALPRRRTGVPVVVLLHPGELDDTPLPREEHDVPVDAVLTADGLTVLREGPLDR